MVMTRNGRATLVQLLVADLSSFTIPDAVDVGNGSPTLNNGSNIYDRYRSVYIGTGATPASSLDTGLEAEITTGGGARKVDTDVNTYLTDDVAGNDAWKANWQATWEFSSAFAISEIAVGNGATANTGLTLTRQTFADPIDVIPTDFMTGVITVTLTGTFVAGDGGAGTAGGAITHNGLREACRMLMDPGTTRLGEDGVAGDWESDDGYGASQGLDQIALEGNGIAVAQSQTALSSELTTNGAARRSGANVTGTLKQNPSGNPPVFGSDTFTNFAGDTGQWRTTFTFTGSVTIDGWALLNGNGTLDIMAIRQVYATPLQLVVDDELTAVIRWIST